MGITMAEQTTEDLWIESLSILEPNLEELNTHTLENLIYSLTRSRHENQEIWEKLVEQVTDRRLIIDDHINEF